MISVVIPTHQPHAGRLQRTLRALRAQTLPASEWECIVVDNASTPALALADWAPHGPDGLRLVREPNPGLSHARRAGFLAGRGEFFVLVDDDNELAPDYLAEVLACFAAHPGVGVLGGKVVPEFETAPAAWIREFDDLLACRDLGAAPLISGELRNPATGHKEYPAFAPVGAGMALRRVALDPWLAGDRGTTLPDRKGKELSSGGDNDLILCALEAGWSAAYFPSLSLTHLIPAGRLEPAYLARLNRGIQKSWMQVLSQHDANPWPSLSPAGATLRKLKAWFAYRAWTGAAAHVRWQGACGHFDGRIK